MPKKVSGGSGSWVQFSRSDEAKRLAVLPGASAVVPSEAMSKSRSEYPVACMSQLRPSLET